MFGLLDASIKELNIEKGFVHKFSYFLFKSWYILYVTPLSIYPKPKWLKGFYSKFMDFRCDVTYSLSQDFKAAHLDDC